MQADSIDDRLLAAGLPSLPRQLWLEIDEAALANNLNLFRELVGPHVDLYAVVKADAYGHGSSSAARALESAGADCLCVASLDEALALRDAGIEARILVLFPIPPQHVQAAAGNQIEVSASDLPTMEKTLDRWGILSEGDELHVHVEVETGLSRGGVKPDEAPGLIRRLSVAPGVRVAGMWTHMASPENEVVTAAQLDAFDRTTTLVRDAGLPTPPRHVAATGGVLTGRAPAYEGVRIGLGMYGLVPLDLPTPDRERGFVDRLQPAMALKCRPLRVERFDAGVGVSYGGRWTAPRESVIATLPVGYGDGIPRPAPWGSALVCGRRVPLVGTVAMDAVMADVTDVPDVTVESEFVLLGRQGDEEISAEDLARLRNTIPWEVVTNMSYRIPRVYHAASVLVGLRTLNAETRVSATVSTPRGDRNE